MEDGIHVQTWDAEEKKGVSNLTHSWREDNPAFYKPTSPFRFSVANHFNNTIKTQCDVVSEPVLMESAKGPHGPNPKWEYEIHPVIDADYTYFTPGREHHAAPQRRAHLEPAAGSEHLDSHAGLHRLRLEAEFRGAVVWIRKHLWDSMLSNTTRTDEMVWSPYYYFSSAPPTSITSPEISHRGLLRAAASKA